MTKEKIETQVHQLHYLPAIDIDAGCVYDSPGMGHLCALDLDNGAFHFQPRLDDWNEEPEIILPSHPQPITQPEPAVKVLYFDIDGVLLDYDDQPKSALLEGRLEAALKQSGFDFIACVSGWVDILAAPVMKLDTLSSRKEALFQKLAPLFSDRDWFLDKLVLVTDTDHRCHYIDLNADWYYIDDWADHFFTAALGPERYKKETEAGRILLCDHEGDGEDVLAWLEKLIF